MRDDAEQVLLVERRPAVVVLTLNRPRRRNALSIDLLGRLTDEVLQAAADPAMRAIVLTGGDRLFSAGSDLDEMLAIHDRDAARRHLLHSRRLCDAVESVRLPVIAAISGYCLTGGLELALACDLRIADDSARFGMTSSRIGGLAGTGGTQRLPRLLGASRAKYLMMLAEQVSPQHALDWGLVEEVVGEDSRTRALEIAEMIATRAPLSIGRLKRAVNLGLDMTLKEGLDLELDLASAIFETADRDEGIAALRERRAPVFEGR